MGAVLGDFGNSIRFTDQPAMPIVLQRFPYTVQLMIAAALYSTLLSLILGTISALKQNSWLDVAVRIFAIGGIATPSRPAAAGWPCWAAPPKPVWPRTSSPA